jgi:hypothetical protein
MEIIVLSLIFGVKLLDNGLDAHWALLEDEII